MKSHHPYLFALVSSVVVLLSGCGGDDVAPLDTSLNTLPQNTTTPTPAPATTTTTTTESPAVAPTLRVELADIIPSEYANNGASLARLAITTLQPTAGNTTSGMVAFIQADADNAQMRVVGKIINIAPGTHGFHLHAIGNCETPDASSAGDHFNPTDAQHASRDAEIRHAGDLGNLVAQNDRTATFDFYDDHLEFTGMNSLIGKAFIVHADEDDLTTQPSGNSGDRIACGVIETRQPALGVPQ